MGGPLGGCDPELLGVFSDVGFCGGIDTTASGAVDVSLHALVQSFYDFLQHSQYGFWCAKLP